LKLSGPGQEPKAATIASPEEVIAMVQQICDTRHEGEVCVTHGWWERFCQRHLDVSLRSASVLSHSRAKGASPEALSEYFDVLEYTLDQYDI